MKKKGFSIPVARWLRSPLQDYVREALSPERIGRQGILRPAAVQRIVDSHMQGTADHGRKLWSLLCFSHWLQQISQP